IGVTSRGVMVWGVFTETVAGPGFLTGDYIGASGEATIAAGLGANVLIGGSNRTVALQPISVTGQTGLNLAVGVANLQLRAAGRWEARSKNVGGKARRAGAADDFAHPTGSTLRPSKSEARRLLPIPPRA